MGETRVVGFHLKTGIETLEVSFAREGKKPQDHVFAMSSSGNPSIETFVFDEVVLFVHSIFGCDAGFLGDNCRKISTATSTTTPATNTRTMTTTTTSPSRSSSKLPYPQVPMFNIVFYLALVLSISGFLVVMLVNILRKRHRQTAENVPGYSVEIDMVESGIFSKDSHRSTSSLNSIASYDFAFIDF
ncbi:hypothetical protein CAEBREN_00107 [Caenorhabditis brenneri]|uniref:Uncharacterized protein n=1 Tax=Caenorhabditis brenneri TaxID=135651 RepID=G0MUX7_CAEBE|nr:hypothetical protein CAEBREN_00107 [Caenorhabditis brenneri]